MALLHDKVLFSSILKHKHTVNMPKHYKGKKSSHKLTSAIHKAVAISAALKGIWERLIKVRIYSFINAKP